MDKALAACKTQQEVAAWLHNRDAMPDDIDEALTQMRNIALEEAANHIMPKNPEHDWTEYARTKAVCATQILGLKTKEQ